MKSLKRWLLIPLITLCVAAVGYAEEAAEESPPQGVTIDLRSPTLCEGVLTTDQGGVVTGPDLRIQAQCIRASLVESEEGNQYKIYAEGDLILQYHNYYFTGERLEYDFATQHGWIYNGHGALEPWYFSADQIEILPDGYYNLYDAYLTTSPSQCPDWRILANTACIDPCNDFTARNITLRLGNVPTFWLPIYHTNLSDWRDSPIRYRFYAGGKQGPRGGISYRLWESDCFESTLRLDYRLSRGPGGGIETAYCSPDENTLFQTTNYVARDSSAEDTGIRFRYRFQGLFTKCFWDDCITFSASYDKLSDREMPTDYADRDLEIFSSGLTQAFVRSQTQNFIADLKARVRVNDFDTIKEEIPTFSTSVHPFVLGPTGIISENIVKAGYFDFRYSEDQPQLPDFNSTRVEFRHSLYRPFHWGRFNLTPEAGVVAIYYGNDPEHSPIWMVLGAFGGEVNTQFYKIRGRTKHVLEPYVQYQYLTPPNTDPSKRFVFDIHDGWYRVSVMRFGLRNLLYAKCDEELDSIFRFLKADVYSFALFDTTTVEKVIPRVYGDLIWDISPTLRYTLGAAWDLERNIVDHLNQRVDWTISDRLAVSTEVRGRSSWSWRKADPCNFMMDFFHTEQQLRNSLVSDRRNTFLLHIYWKLQHNLALALRLRRGWHRLTEPNYNEYQIDIFKTIRSSWHTKLSYQYKEDDHRVAFYINFGLKKPACCDCFYDQADN